MKQHSHLMKAKRNTGKSGIPAILTAQYLGDEGEQVQDREKECKVLKEELTKELAQCAGIMDTNKVSLQTAVLVRGAYACHTSPI
jgi:hypothetical protein